MRDWLFVEDHADALLLVAEEGIPGSSYNIGGLAELSNLSLVEKICEILNELRPKAQGSYSDQITFVSDRPGHDLRYAIDITKIREELNWEPKKQIEQGLYQTVRWYLDNENWWQPLLVRKLNSSWI